MADQSELEKLYREALSALKAKDYDRANNFLKQILVIDENYKDASRLLSRIVKEKRRRWYNDVRIWGTSGILLLIGLGFFLAPKISSLYAIQPVIKATTTPFSTVTAAPTQTLLPTLTPVPLTWKRSSIGQEFVRAMITTIVIDPKDQDIIYIGTWGAGVYKSIDGGISWRPNHSGLNRGSVDALVVDPQNSQNLFTALDLGGLFKSEDGGTNWVNMDRGRGCGESFIYIDPTDSNHFLGGVGCEGLTESSDGGLTWQFALAPQSTFWNPTSIAIHPTDNKIQLLAQWDKGVYQTLDGQTWTRAPIPGTYFDGPQKITIGLDSTGQSTFLVASEEGLFVSFDNGNRWDTPLRDYCSAVVADRQGNAIAACRNGLFKSINGGHSWEQVTSPEVHGGINALAISPSDPHLLYAAGNGFSISKDGGKSWIEASNGIPATTMDLRINPASPSNLFATEYCTGMSCSGRALYQSQNSGQQWEAVTDGTNSYDFAIDANGQLFYRLNQDNIIRFKGGHWADEQPLPGVANQIEANPYVPGMVYIIADHKFYHSDNEGITWNAGSDFEVNFESHFAFSSQPGVIYVINQNEGGLEYLYSDNNGQAWKSCSVGPSGQIRDLSKSIFIVDPHNSQHLYLASLDFGIFISSDGCATWRSSNTGITDQTLNTIAIDPNTSGNLYVGTDGGAFVSFDFGETWSEINDGLLGATVIYSIVVDKDSNVYAATPYGVFKLENK